jgi:hypothetical protein
MDRLVAAHPRLASLRIDMPVVCVAALQRLVHLTALDLADAWILERPLPALPRLRDLHLRGAASWLERAAFVRWMNTFVCLERFAVDTLNIGDLTCLRTVTGTLQVLELTDTDLPNACVLDLAACRQLRVLRLKNGLHAPIAPEHVAFVKDAARFPFLHTFEHTHGTPRMIMRRSLFPTLLEHA